MELTCFSARDSLFSIQFGRIITENPLSGFAAESFINRENMNTFTCARY